MLWGDWKPVVVLWTLVGLGSIWPHLKAANAENMKRAAPNTLTPDIEVGEQHTRQD